MIIKISRTRNNVRQTNIYNIKNMNKFKKITQPNGLYMDENKAMSRK